MPTSIIDSRNVARDTGFRKNFATILLPALFLMGTLAAQTSTSKPPAAPAPTPTPQSDGNSDGMVYNGYTIHQEIEFGGRIGDISGSQAIWDTYVNENSGPRLFNQWFEMRSIMREGSLFDRLSFSNIGYGGDPNNMTRARISKDRWYDFQAQFRRDRNVFDYDLFANPLNPQTGSNPTVLITDSPHEFENVRRMWDYNLLLFPTSRYRMRMGYNRNVSEGPTFSSVHYGTEAELLQNWRNLNQAYSFGFDVRTIPRTQISYDETIQAFKGDTTWTLANTPYQTSTGVPADLGLGFNTANNIPCAAPISNATTTPPTINSTCNSYLSFNRTGNIRSTLPVEKLSFQSSYFKKVELSGSMSYSNTNLNLPNYDQIFNGEESSNRRIENLALSAMTRRLSVNGDFGATVFINEHFHFQNTLHYNDYRLPGDSIQADNWLFAVNVITAPLTFNSATCPATPSTCPVHVSGSPADLSNIQWFNYQGQRTKVETSVLDMNLNRHFGGHIGFRYQDREITIRNLENQTLTYYPSLPNRGSCVGVTLQANGTCVVTLAPATDNEYYNISDYAGLVGLWFQPSQKFRANFDVDFASADYSYTRIDSRHHQIYKARTLWKPTEGWSVNAAVKMDERRNPQSDVLNYQHDRAYSFSVVYDPAKIWGTDLNFSYNDVYSTILICYTATPNLPGATTCPGSTLQTGTSIYTSKAKFFSGNFFVKPAPRVIATLGYTLNTDDGTSLILNPIQPLGPLNYVYHLPSGSVQVKLAPRWTWTSGWNYYDYHEGSDPGPTLPRNMHANMVNLSLKYKF